MEPKKISFGFSKVTKKSNLIINKATIKPEAKVELIKCVEGQEIKLIEEKPEEKPLVIPLRKTQRSWGSSSSGLASLTKRRGVLLGEEEPDATAAQKEEPNTSNSVKETEDIEKRAARELLADVQSNSSTDAASALVLPVVKPDDLPLEGAKESSLDEYANIPLECFGKAILLGMGWKEPPKTTKRDCPPLGETPMVRPKGMGLGADKTINKKPLLVAPEENEVLEIKTNAYVRILAGKYNELYGQIEGFDDYTGRVIVKMALGGNKESFHEYQCQPVSRKEYAQYGKCINKRKYEEYKKKENEHGQIILPQEEKDKIEKPSKIKGEKDVKKEEYPSSESENKFKKLFSGSGNGIKYIKKESDWGRDYGYNRERETSSHRKEEYCYDEKLYRRNDKTDRPVRESSRDREYRKNYRMDEYRKTKTYESQTNYYRDRSDSQKNLSKKDRSLNMDKQRKLDGDSYMESSENKVVHITASSSESLNDSHSSKRKKTKKTKSSKKKSKKLKRNKSRHRSETSETESSLSDTDSSSSSNEERRRRKLRKKTKKSKKQRERSRSRDRR